MSSTIPILRARRERRLARQRVSESRTRSTLLTVGMILSLVVAALIIFTAFAYVNLTHDLPSAQLLPVLLNPPDGLLLQPTRIYDRTGQNILFTFAPDDSQRRYLPLSETTPQHLPEVLGDAVVARIDPYFWEHSGYDLLTITNYESPTKAQIRNPQFPVPKFASSCGRVTVTRRPGILRNSSLRVAPRSARRCPSRRLRG